VEVVEGYRSEREVEAERLRREAVAAEANRRERDISLTLLVEACDRLRASGRRPDCVIEERKGSRWKVRGPAWFLGSEAGGSYRDGTDWSASYALGANGRLYRGGGIGDRKQFRVVGKWGDPPPGPYDLLTQRIERLLAGEEPDQWLEPAE
jgi:hypothetical protein